MTKTITAFMLVFMLLPGLAAARDADAEDNEQPEVLIVSPPEGARVSGEMSVIAEAQDIDGAVLQVELFIDGIMVGIGLDEVFEYMWNTEELEFGSWHEIYATALDDDGMTGISPMVAVVVDTQYWSGKVIERDLDDSIIKVRNPQTREKEFKIKPTTVIVDKNGKNIKMKDISNYDNVDIDYKKSGSKNIAIKITRTNR